MIVIGLALLIVAAIFGLGILWKNTFPVPDVVLFEQSLGIGTARGFFLAGIIAGAVVMLGVAMILAGMRRKGSKALQHRKERHRAKAVDSDRDQLAAENDELHRKLGQGSNFGNGHTRSETYDEPRPAGRRGGWLRSLKTSKRERTTAESPRNRL